MRAEFDDSPLFLKSQTIAKYGQGSEVREAKEKMADVQKTMLHKEVKCKRTDRVDEHPAKSRKRVHQTAAVAVVGLLVGAM